MNLERKFSFILTTHKKSAEIYKDVIFSDVQGCVSYPPSFSDQSFKFILVTTKDPELSFTQCALKHPELAGFIPDNSEYYDFMKDFGFDLMSCDSFQVSKIMNTLGKSGLAWRQALPEEK